MAHSARPSDHRGEFGLTCRMRRRKGDHTDSLPRPAGTRLPGPIQGCILGVEEPPERRRRRNWRDETGGIRTWSSPARRFWRSLPQLCFTPPPPERRIIRTGRSPSSCRSPPAAAWTRWFGSMPKSCRAFVGKPVVVRKRPGASLMLAAAFVAKAPADGYTLLVSTSSAMAINPVLYKNHQLRSDQGFRADLALREVADHPGGQSRPAGQDHLRISSTLAKEAKTPLTYSSPGAGVAQHLSMEYMKKRFGLDITHVPYKNTPQSIADIAAGHVNLGFAEAGASLPLIKDGKLRALAVSATTRLPSLPDVPPFSEAAKAPDFEAVSWHVLFAPAGTPTADRRSPACRDEEDHERPGNGENDREDRAHSGGHSLH